MKDWFKSGSPWIWLTAGAVAASVLAVAGVMALTALRGLVPSRDDEAFEERKATLLALDIAGVNGVRSSVLDWPYVEGLRIDEAMHPLTLMAFGLYGEVLPPQNGAPLRLVVPWKYGFKSAKSIVAIRLTEKPSPSSWMRANPREYGYYSNVNPTVDHPRWSQATERRIGEGGLFAPRKPTLMFNGYAAQVGQLYAGMDLRKFY
mgnify:CR=1 FL=1